MSKQMDIEQNRPTTPTKNQEDSVMLLLDETKNSSPTPPHQNGTSPKGPTSQNSSPSQQTPSHMDSSSIQMMGQAQPPGYDPNRIPASIFSAKPANPSEWSVASNESLFSIHMGNNSFSRDYAILYGKSADLQDSQLGMSSELPRLDDWNNNNNNKQLKSSELIGLSPVIEESWASLNDRGKSSRADRGGLEIENHEKMENETIANATVGKQDLGDVVTVSGGANRMDIRKVGVVERLPSSPQTFPSPPRFSDESRNNSGSSFAFPVLVNDHGKPESLKVVPEAPEPPASQAEDSKETANASQTRWFSFVLCWPRCC